ncbi:hypothetical protein [Lysinibacillus sp. CTST325]
MPLTLRFRADKTFVVAAVTLSHRKHPLRCRVSGQHGVGHEGVITGRDAVSPRSAIADPQGVDQPPLQSPNQFFAIVFLLI